MKTRSANKMPSKGGFDPNILAFDTSLAHCSVAYLNDFPRNDMTEEMSRGQGERLFPMLEALLTQAGGTWQDLDAIAVGIGPGNFTGIRISVSAARGLGLALKIPVIGISTFEVLRDPDGPFAMPSEIICLPAPRGHVYTQHFRYGRPTAQPTMYNLDQLPDNLQFPINTTVIGHAAEQLCIAGHASNWDDVSLTEKEIANHFAARIARKAEAYLRFGNHEHARPAPLYVRAADAAPPRDAAPVILS